MKKQFNYFLGKITSARFLITLFFTYTYCKVLAAMLSLLANGTIAVETFLGVLSGFTPLVILIIEWYFKRSDRWTNEK